MIPLSDWDYPTKPKPGYVIEPDYKTLCSMTKEQISAVEDFEIRNMHG